MLCAKRFKTLNGLPHVVSTKIFGNTSAQRCLSTIKFPKSLTNDNNETRYHHRYHHDDEPHKTNGRIPRTLYRQILRACKYIEKMGGVDQNGSVVQIPLDAFVPPITLNAPSQIDSYRLEVLASSPSGSSMDDAAVTFARQKLHRAADIRPKHMTVPIHYVTDLANLVRVAFKFNSDDAPDFQKDRIALAFEILKTLNEMKDRLAFLKKDREEHSNREGVDFRIGDVVQHKEERWRGVVTLWEKNNSEQSSSELREEHRKTSLTTKQYESPLIVTYTVCLDASDALGASSNWCKAAQSDLTLVDDPALKRILGRDVGKIFSRFDESLSRFIPHELLAYEYAADVSSDDLLPPCLPADHERVCDDIMEGTKAIAAQLERVILEETMSSQFDPRKLDLIAMFQEELRLIEAGDVLQNTFRFTPTETVSKTSKAAAHVHALLNITMEIIDVMVQRNISLEHRDKIKFRLGEVVHHKIFNYRGVVVAWDPRPTLNVSRWDGVQHIENPLERPFYRIIPDQRDCIDAFGGERPWMYVCEENLEPCPQDRAFVEVDIGPDWERDPQSGSFAPPSGIRFKYGEDLDDGGVTSRCMARLASEITEWQCSARSNSSDNDEISDRLSIKNLYILQRIVDRVSDSFGVQEMIKEMRKAHERFELRSRLEAGMVSLIAGRGEMAHSIFSELVKEDPLYAEAWNKLATSEFMLGRLDDSKVSTEKVLALDPLHSQAIVGLGLIYYEKDDYVQAAEHFRRGLSIDPWSPASGKLSVCLDLMNKIVLPEEL